MTQIDARGTSQPILALLLAVQYSELSELSQIHSLKGDKQGIDYKYGKGKESESSRRVP